MYADVAVGMSHQNTVHSPVVRAATGANANRNTDHTARNANVPRPGSDTGMPPQ